MKFSILLPTRNRLDLLRGAVETVRRQRFDDWEIVVSDNCSEDDVAGYVDSLADGRVRYFRTERPVSVTENWNNALAKCRGDYVVMLGDDDGLIDGSLDERARVLDRFAEPDVLYSRTVQFVHPGVIAHLPEGQVFVAGAAPFFNGREEPFVLDPARARALARRTMRFELAFDYNMQFATVRREHAESLGDGGGFFRSAFPDYYAMTLLFLTARVIVVDPRPLAIVGVTPKSYGWYHANHREADGLAMLAGVDRYDGPALTRPGDDIKAGWLDAAEALAARGVQGERLVVDHGRLRRLRVLEAAEAYRLRSLGRRDVRPIFSTLGVADCVLVILFLVCLRIASRPLSPRRRVWLRAKALRHIPFWEAKPIPGRFESIDDVFEQVHMDAGP